MHKIIVSICAVIVALSALYHYVVAPIIKEQKVSACLNQTEQIRSKIKHFDTLTVGKQKITDKNLSLYNQAVARCKLDGVFISITE